MLFFLGRQPPSSPFVHPNFCAHDCQNVATKSTLRGFKKPIAPRREAKEEDIIKSLLTLRAKEKIKVRCGAISVVLVKTMYSPKSLRSPVASSQVTGYSLSELPAVRARERERSRRPRSVNWKSQGVVRRSVTVSDSAAKRTRYFLRFKKKTALKSQFMGRITGSVVREAPRGGITCCIHKGNG